MKIILNGYASRSFYVNAEIPQGSILGPALFLIFVNDLPDVINSQLGSYADENYLHLS